MNTVGFIHRLLIGFLNVALKNGLYNCISPAYITREGSGRSSYYILITIYSHIFCFFLFFNVTNFLSKKLFIKALKKLHG